MLSNNISWYLYLVFTFSIKIFYSESYIFPKLRIGFSHLINSEIADENENLLGNFFGDGGVSNLFGDIVERDVASQQF